jgi:organic hydroperoxide reductase OsmC/OhrA
MHLAATRQKKKLPEDATVTADISFADREDNVGFAIVAKLTAKAPGMEKAELEDLMRRAHDICPYSNLIRFAHDVELVAG